MKLAFVLSILILVTFPQTMLAQKMTAGAVIPPPQPSEFLFKRASTGAIQGTFRSFAQQLYARDKVRLHTDLKEVEDIRLHSIFPDFYKPTYKELFDTVAYQTKLRWKYDPTHNRWFFAARPRELPFTIMALDWHSYDEGMYVRYVPPTASGGMDIYLMGSYSDASSYGSDRTELMEKIRDSLAIKFAKNLKPDVTALEMKKVQVAGAEALYFETPSPLSENIWRQWVFLKYGRALVIVSAIAKNDDQTWTDVDVMVNSIQLKKVRRRMCGLGAKRLKACPEQWSF